MQQAELQVNRLPAVDGRALTSAELKRYSTRLATFFQPRGVIGCYLSHIKFWKMVVEYNYSHAIVFEDDVHLADNFKERMVTHLQNLGKSKSSFRCVSSPYFKPLLRKL
jgi:GR25 family glycosyltransferase involved in LPS biosynthesis